MPWVVISAFDRETARQHSPRLRSLSGRRASGELEHLAPRCKLHLTKHHLDFIFAQLLLHQPVIRSHLMTLWIQYLKDWLYYLKVFFLVLRTCQLVGRPLRRRLLRPP